MRKVLCLVIWGMLLLSTGVILAQDYPCDTYIRSARIYLNRKTPDYESALKNLEAGYKKCYDDPLLHELMGRIFADQNKIDKMIEEFRIAKEKKHPKPELMDTVLTSKWAEQFKRGTTNLDEAEVFAKLASDLNGVIELINSGQPDSAAARLAEIQKSVPQNLTVTMREAMSQFNLNKYTEAAELFQKAITQSDSVQNRLKLDATKHFLSCARIDSTKFEPFLNAASQYIELGQPEQADSLLARAYQLQPKNLNVLLGYGINLFNLKKYDQAIEIFQKAVAVDSTSKEALINLASIYSQKGDREKSMEMWDVLINKGLADKDVYFNRGLVLLVESEKISQQIRDKDDLYSKDPKNAELKKEIEALTAQREQVLGKTAGDFTKVTLLDSLDAEAWYQLGFIHLLQNDLDKALTALEKCVSLKPDYQSAWEALAIIYTKKGMLDKAKLADAKSKDTGSK